MVVTSTWESSTETAIVFFRFTVTWQYRWYCDPVKSWVACFLPIRKSACSMNESNELSSAWRHRPRLRSITRVFLRRHKERQSNANNCSSVSESHVPRQNEWEN